MTDNCQLVGTFTNSVIYFFILISNTWRKFKNTFPKTGSINLLLKDILAIFLALNLPYLNKFAKKYP